MLGYAGRLQEQFCGIPQIQVRKYLNLTPKLYGNYRNGGLNASRRASLVYKEQLKRCRIHASIATSALADHQFARNMSELTQKLSCLHASIVKSALTSHQIARNMNELTQERSRMHLKYCKKCFNQPSHCKSSLFKLLLILFCTLFASHSSLFELQYGKSATVASNEALYGMTTQYISFYSMISNVNRSVCHLGYDSTKVYNPHRCKRKYLHSKFHYYSNTDAEFNI